MDSLHRIARDCRTLLLAVQLTLFGVLFWNATDGFRLLGLSLGVVAFGLTAVTVVRMLSGPVVPVEDGPADEDASD